MKLNLDDLTAMALALPRDSREHLAKLLTESTLGEAVRDDGASYGQIDAYVENVIAKMKSVTVVLPDELARQAQAAGLLSEKRLTELIRSALHQQDVVNQKGQRRRLVRHHGHLVVEALPGEPATTDAEVRDLLNKMEW